jgi:hypothetical protein
VSPRFGVLAEDGTDREAIGVLLRRIAQDDHGVNIGVRGKGFGGCAHLRRKAAAHLRFLAQECVATVLVHDLDRDKKTNTLNDIEKLRMRLAAVQVPPSLRHHICIPVEELEAWFWSDQNVLDRVCGPRKVKAEYHPDRVVSPKERLIMASSGESGRARFTTSMNRELVAMLDLNLCGERCESFRELRRFVGEVVHQ